jgi:hypothetical protein
MATELPRPGVEVVQEFASASPTIVTPTLVPCVVAPFFEVIEVLKSDGTSNPDAKLATPYEQLEQLILQSSFPSPRENIDQVDVLEDTIRVFFSFGGSMLEVSDDSAFLTSFTDAIGPAAIVSVSPYVRGTLAMEDTTGGLGYDIDGRTIVLFFDGNTTIPISAGGLPTSKNVTITFAAATPGGKLSLDQVVEQINAVIPGVASSVEVTAKHYLQLKSTKYGAHAIVVVRSSGSANAGTDRLGFSGASDTFAAGSGFYAIDDNDGDTTSPRFKIFTGNQQGTIASPGAVQITAPNFNDANILVGDEILADGVNVGAIHLVESDQLTMEVEQSIISQDNPFAPRRIVVRAMGLTYPAPAASEAATMLGSISTTAASKAFVYGQAAFTGTANPSESLTVNVTINGVAQTPETVTSGAGDWTTIALCIASINAQATNFEAYESNSSGVETPAGGYLALRTNDTGKTTSITAVSCTVAALLGFTSLPLYDNGEDIRYGSALNGKYFTWSIDNNPKQYTVTFVTDQDDNGVGIAQVIEKINALTPGVAAEDDSSPPKLELTSQKVGEASEVKVWAGNANTTLGFTDNSRDTGNGRPAPDMAVDVNGDVVLQGQLLRDNLTGVPYNPGQALTYIAYKGLRLDMSPEADNPALIRITDVSTLELAADPISTDNPGALMTYLALLNAPAVEVTAIGVPEVSDDAPDGTPLGYTKCAEFLENEEVYALCTASQISTVHQTFLTHVNVMSEPEQKGERIYFFNPPIPTRANPTLVGSGTDANSTATANECVVDVNIAPALIAAGLDPNTDLNPATGEIENEVYLDIGGSDNYYLVKKVDNGTKLTLRTSFVAGDGNDDSFFSDEAFPTSVISDDWTVYIRGAELLISGTTKPDRSKIAETIQGAASAYGFRRGFYVFPDQCAINVTGLEQIVKGYYATACVVGMVGQLPPQQGFTNYPITGLTRVVGSNDKFTNKQLNVMAAGGVYILVQDFQGAPVICRHQLSTDTTSIEARELSITKVVDFTAKFLRGGLRNFIGRSNITQGFLDQLSTIIQGQLGFLTDNGILIGADINNLIQDADNPDTVLVDITLDVPFPCNYIRITLII